MRELKSGFVHRQAVQIGRTPRGVRELKFIPSSSGLDTTGRTPRGVRELKLGITQNLGKLYVSHSAWGA